MKYPMNGPKISDTLIRKKKQHISNNKSINKFNNKSINKQE